MIEKEVSMSSSKKCYVELTVIFEQEDDGRWTAECQELGTATFGDSFEATKADIIDAIELHLKTLDEVGEIELFFEENGIKIKHRPSTNLKINIPKRPNAVIFTYEYNMNCGERVCL